MTDTQTTRCPFCQEEHLVETLPRNGSPKGLEMVHCPKVPPGGLYLVPADSYGVRMSVLGHQAPNGYDWETYEVRLDERVAMAVCNPLTEKLPGLTADQTYTLANGVGIRCRVQHCSRRQPRPDEMTVAEAVEWADYGCCSREHSVEWYGPEAID